MVIRDLTLRSAASFGSFHLIRLLYDEYMFYVIEHLVAEATGKTPMAVMGEVSDTNKLKKFLSLGYARNLIIVQSLLMVFRKIWPMQLVPTNL